MKNIDPETVIKGLRQSLELCRADLLRHGYTVKEVDLATWVLERLMAHAYALGTVNEVDPGKILSCIIAFLKTMDETADQEVATIIGKHGPLGKN